MLANGGDDFFLAFPEKLSSLKPADSPSFSYLSMSLMET
jgi:hypothetical protein